MYKVLDSNHMHLVPDFLPGFPIPPLCTVVNIFVVFFDTDPATKMAYQPAVVVVWGQDPCSWQQSTLLHLMEHTCTCSDSIRLRVCALGHGVCKGRSKSSDLIAMPLYI